jgi:hypothetical protein
MKTLKTDTMLHVPVSVATCPYCGDKLTALYESGTQLDDGSWIANQLTLVIEPDQALEVIEVLHERVDFWKVGKINHNKELEAAHDWGKFREGVTELLDKHGANYYLKRSLTVL